MKCMMLPLLVVAVAMGSGMAQSLFGGAWFGNPSLFGSNLFFNPFPVPAYQNPARLQTTTTLKPAIPASISPFRGNSIGVNRFFSNLLLQPFGVNPTSTLPPTTSPLTGQSNGNPASSAPALGFGNNNLPEVHSSSFSSSFSSTNNNGNIVNSGFSTSDVDGVRDGEGFLQRGTLGTPSDPNAINMVENVRFPLRDEVLRRQQNTQTNRRQNQPLERGQNRSTARDQNQPLGRPQNQPSGPRQNQPNGRGQNQSARNSNTMGVNNNPRRGQQNNNQNPFFNMMNNLFNNFGMGMPSFNGLDPLFPRRGGRNGNFGSSFFRSFGGSGPSNFQSNFREYSNINGQVSGREGRYNPQSGSYQMRYFR